MNILERARRDARRITSNADSGFAVSAIFTAPNNTTATVNVIHSKHHMGVDTDGNIVNSQNAHVNVSEILLTAQGYPVRVNNKVKLNNHRVAIADSTGVTINYIVKQWMPDETLGTILLILESYGG